jgi:FkbM family methyltransferase
MKFEKQVRMLRNLLDGRQGDVPLGLMANQLIVSPFLDEMERRLRPRIDVNRFVTGEDGEWITFSFVQGTRPMQIHRKHLPGLQQILDELTIERNGHFYEKPQTAISPGDVVVDCGACEGLFSILAQPRCRHVYAIEPIPDYCEGLRRTFDGVANVDVLPVALSKEKGRLMMRSGGMASSICSDGDLEVEVSTIDSLFYEKGIKIDYLKADLEGHESLMLQGAARTIRASKPKLAITTYHTPHDARDIIEAVKEIDASYRFRLEGVMAGDYNVPIMLHAW